jgi:hypothetical protein
MLRPTETPRNVCVIQEFCGIILKALAKQVLPEQLAFTSHPNRHRRIGPHSRTGILSTPRRNMSQQVKEFFKAYERTNSSSESSAIGDFYAGTFMFGAANGVQVVAREDFLKVVPRMKAHLSSMGLFQTQLRSVEAHPINSKYLLAKTGWRMQVRSASASKYVDVCATYVLMRGQDDALSIVFQIDHQDLAALIKDQQI